MTTCTVSKEKFSTFGNLLGGVLGRNSICHNVSCNCVATTRKQKSSGNNQCCCQRLSSRAVKAISHDFFLFQNVDDQEQADPNHIDEVPVVGHHNGTSGLSVTKFLSGEGPTDNQQEGDKSAGHVQSVETCCDVEGASVGVAADADALRHQSCVLQNLTRYEDCPKYVANEEPLN